MFLGARREDNLKRIVEDIRSGGGEAAYRSVDVTRRDQVESFVEAAVQEFGRLDVLVNNAGLMPLSPLEAQKVDEWERMVDVNIKGVLYGISAALPRMQDQRDGHIINLSSVAGHEVFEGSAVYSGAKFAVWAISEGRSCAAGVESVRSTTPSSYSPRKRLRRISVR